MTRGSGMGVYIIILPFAGREELITLSGHERDSDIISKYRMERRPDASVCDSCCICSHPEWLQ